MSKKTRLSHQRGWIEKVGVRRDGQMVYKLRWYVRDCAKVSGWRKETFSQPFPSRKQAEKELDRRMEAANRQNATQGLAGSQRMTFSSFSESLWQSYVAKEKIKPSTCYAHDSVRKNYLLPEFGNVFLDEISSVMVTLFLDKIRKKGLSDQYQLNIYSLLRSMLEVAVAYRLVDHNPVHRKLHRPEVVKKDKPTLAPDELRKLLWEEIPDYWRPLFITDAVLGLRAGELFGLRWQNFSHDERSGQLELTHSLWRGKLVTPKTEGSATTVPLPDFLLQILLEQNRRSVFTQPDDFIFCREDGSPGDPDHLRKHVLYPAMERAGIKRQARCHGFHIFRHSSGTIVHQQTGSLKLAQEHLRHAAISTTADIYVHTNNDEKKKAAEAVMNVILPVPCPPYCPLEDGGHEQRPMKML